VRRFATDTGIWEERKERKFYRIGEVRVRVRVRVRIRVGATKERRKEGE